MNENPQSAGEPSRVPQRKLGADHGELSKRTRKRHANFEQSVDIREDRGIRQSKTDPKNRK